MKEAIWLLMMVCPWLTQAQISDSSIRKIQLQGASNFRDIGGYPTQQGTHIKWRKIYRSAEIHQLTEDDLDTLEQRNIKLIFDFRGPAEVQMAKDNIPDGAKRISLPAGSEQMGNRMEMMQQLQKTTNGDSIMLQLYTGIDFFKKRYKPVFDSLLAAPEEEAILFHCTAGKDRTGICSALILHALGVQDSIIMEDFLASNYYRQGDTERMKKLLIETFKMNPLVVDDIMGVKPFYLQATYDAIISQYGSINHFLNKEMELTPENLKILRSKFTE
jgi:protein-tyrosine phosphatase